MIEETLWFGVSDSRDEFSDRWSAKTSWYYMMEGFVNNLDYDTANSSVAFGTFLGSCKVESNVPK